MTSKERKSRQLILNEIMLTMKVTEQKAEELLSELETFKLVKFDSTGNFYLQQIEE